VDRTKSRDDVVRAQLSFGGEQDCKDGATNVEVSDEVDL
jgi:hypothetical protein